MQNNPPTQEALERLANFEFEVVDDSPYQPPSPDVPDDAEEKPETEVEDFLEAPERPIHARPVPRLVVATLGIGAIVSLLVAVLGAGLDVELGGESKSVTARQALKPEEEVDPAETLSQQNGDLKSQLALSREEAEMAKINQQMEESKKNKVKGDPAATSRARANTTAAQRRERHTTAVRTAPARIPVSRVPAPRPVAPPRSFSPAPRPVAPVAALAPPAPVIAPPVQEPTPPQPPTDILAEQQLAFLEQASFSSYEPPATLVSQQDSFLEATSTVSLPVGTRMQGEIVSQSIAAPGSTFLIRLTQGPSQLPREVYATAQVSGVSAHGQVQATVTEVNGQPVEGEITVRQDDGNLLTAKRFRQKRPFLRSPVGRMLTGLGQRLGEGLIEQAVPSNDFGSFGDFGGIDRVFVNNEAPQFDQRAGNRVTSMLLNPGPVQLFVQSNAVIQR
jgi:hypothetical protein